MAVRVTSEIGALRKVVVHRPGTELLAVTPTNRTEYLYDDIIDLHDARIEHDKALARVMTAVLKDDTELFKQFMDNDSFRRWLTDTVFNLTYADEPRRDSPRPESR